MADEPRTTNAEPTDTERLQLERARLECEKLRAEIAQTSLAWWKRPANLASAATLAALLTGWLSGYFPAEREKLQKEVADLRAQGVASKQEALLVNSDLARLRAERDDFKTRSRELAEQAEVAQNRLRTEIAALKAEQTTAGQDLSRLRGERDGFVQQIQELSRQAEATQRRIDDAYLRLKLASANAAYALSHLKPIRDFSADVRARLGGSVTRLPADLAEPVRRMLDDDRLAEDIVKITEMDLDRLGKELQTIPASPWAVRLLPHPDGKLYEPDWRRYYDLADGRFHDAR